MGMTIFQVMISKSCDMQHTHTFWCLLVMVALALSVKQQLSAGPTSSSRRSSCCSSCVGLVMRRSGSPLVR
eukprot:365658-Chlamydomonas_euryale.AAC.9